MSQMSRQQSLSGHIQEKNHWWAKSKKMLTQRAKVKEMKLQSAFEI